ncbi:glycosyltransferase family 4 protein [Thauera sp. 2A1]|uniref:glycosyltransferase family 4 protein n=1 Tax=Thauera sp. 2A1 TaxID=2570191 RepID=UPI001292A6E9|nr:glycosyltransferase family 4 protein [Thauera sp. 2A1]KAI5912972.1 glycosyltransferase family 4 protein [Thauera sp. 2A1]
MDGEGMARVLINAANLHVGGGVQVATSFVLECSESLRSRTSRRWSIYVSSAVDRNLKAAGFKPDPSLDYRVLDIHGIASLSAKNAHLFRGFDLIFTVFGPLYVLGRIRSHVAGFAQPWIIYPENEVAERLGLGQRLKLRAKFALQWFFFARAERLVVELGHVKDRLERVKGFHPSRVDVVSNCVSALYFDESKWAPVPAFAEAEADVVRVGFVTRDYAHKNLDFLPRVGRELARISGKRYRFYVTLNEHEWGSRSTEFKEFVTTVGPLTVAQCPTFYRAMDAVIFPSLLECFSATPLEALAMRRPLFASDRGFVRDVCAEHAMYFDPLDPASAAALIVDWFERKSQDEQSAHVERGYRHLRSLPGSRERARAYLEIIEKQLKLSCSSV